MRRLRAAILCSSLASAGATSAAAQAPEAPAALPSTPLAYTIGARFDPRTREIAAREVVRWVNPADVPLTALPLHLYQNAFSHAETTWMKGATAVRDFALDDVLALSDDPWGFTEVERVVRCDDDVGAALRWARGEATAPPAGRPLHLRYVQPDDGNPLDRSLAEARLPRGLAPGAALCLAIAFRTRLPVPIARTGAVDGYAHAAQWFPKLGVLEPPGKRGVAGFHWAARQFHGPTEFYADFADYEVTLDVPQGLTVVATGEGLPAPGAPDGYSRVRFAQRAVHDFAWVAARALHLETHRFTPAGGGGAIAITYGVPRGQEGIVPRMRRAAERTFDVLGARIGPYPYSTMTVLHPPWRARATAGMEYPTLVTGMVGVPMWRWPGIARVRLLESTLVHEVGHSYFYGVLASDEQREAFLDEGFNSYWESVVLEELAGGDRDWYRFLGHPVDPVSALRRWLGQQRGRYDEAVVQTPSDTFYPGTHAAQIYVRPQLILLTAARRFGQPALDAIFAAYYARHRFSHPDADDFFAVVDALGPPELAAFLHEAFSARRLPDFAVLHAQSERWRAPLGRLPLSDGGVSTVRPGERARQSEAFVGLDPEAGARPGAVLAEITDPGYVWHDARRAGRVERVWLAQSRRGRAGAGDAAPAYYRSSVRLRGPGTRHLPVDVRFEFADGAVVDDRWDGRSSWRGYRLLHGARLVAVRIDPNDELAIDVDPDNNGLRVEPDPRLGARWSRWLSALGHWLLGAVTLCL